MNLHSPEQPFMSKPIEKMRKIPDRDIGFTAARSSGPGGQGVNTTDSKAVLEFVIKDASCLTEEEKATLRTHPLIQNRLKSDGETISIAMQVTRFFHQNKRMAKRLLETLVTEALKPVAVRVEKMPRAVKQKVQRKKRLQKTFISEKKKQRGRVGPDHE